ncbi:unnamed protein product [Orchesella dallaii]|uniref:Caspase family p20 domain-containing protein n=1 Tax=Orchesella dallaii TaxID=48710 RepID=A0ABP1R4R8_9HEXA
MESKKRANPIGDTHDSFPNNDNNQLSDETDAKSCIGGPPVGRSSAVMPVGRDSEVYYMSHPKRGKAVIFNHDKFEIGLSERSGTEVDEQKLKTCLSKLGFEVWVHRNLKHEKIKDALEKLRKEDHSDRDCLLIVVLSHGGENKIYSSDLEYKPKELWEGFTPDKCPTLAGKAKMFFINACRGKGYDDGTLLKGLASRRQVDGPSNSKPSYRIPNQADFLTVFSTSEGIVSCEIYF